MATRRADRHPRGHVDRLPSEETVNQFLDMLRAGNYIKTAAAYTGLRESVIYQWLREAANEGARPWAVQFAQSVQEARAFAQAASLQIIQTAARAGTWQAAAWFLERSSPREWGRWERHEIDISAEAPAVSVRSQLAAAIRQLGEDMVDDVIDVEATDEPVVAGTPGPVGADGDRPPSEPAGRRVDGTGPEGGLVVRRTA